MLINYFAGELINRNVKSVALHSFKDKFARWVRVAKQLLVNYFDLLVAYLAGKSVDRNVYPVSLLPLDNEVCESGFTRRVASTLREYINHEIPNARLAAISQRANTSLSQASDVVVGRAWGYGRRRRVRSEYSRDVGTKAIVGARSVNRIGCRTGNWCGRGCWTRCPNDNTGSHPFSYQFAYIPERPFTGHCASCPIDECGREVTRIYHRDRGTA